MSQLLFTYGTLMCSDIMTTVVGAELTAMPARLEGAQRYAIEGEDYPGLVIEAGSVVDGVVYQVFSDAQWHRLDVFEGDEYWREQVSVLLHGHQRKRAYTYMMKPEYSNRLTDQVWDYERFLSGGKRRFCARYSGFGELPKN